MTGTTQTVDKVLSTASTQSDPKPMKRTKDVHIQTETVEFDSTEKPIDNQIINLNFSHRSSISSPPVSNTDTSTTNGSRSSSMLNQSHNDDDDEDSDSDNELSPEDLAKLVADVKNSSRSSTRLPPPEMGPSDSVYIRNLAPSYGHNKGNMTTYGEESICEQLAKKYGISTTNNIEQRKVSPEETFQNSADMSVATAQYFERHAIGRRRPPHRTFQNTEPIVDFLKLEKLQNFK